MEIEKGKPERLFPSESWQPVDLQGLFKIAEALSDPIRQWAYTVLEQGPMRQAEMARKASEKFGRKITNILMSYHLKKLEEAGLIRFETGFGNAKIVHRNLELKLEAKPCETIPRAGLEEELASALRALRNAGTLEKIRRG